MKKLISLGLICATLVLAGCDRYPYSSAYPSVGSITGPGLRGTPGHMGARDAGVPPVADFVVEKH